MKPSTAVSTPSSSDRDRLRRLAGEMAAIAALPVQAEKKALWRRLNGLRPVRPMVAIDQVCWNEMNVNDELTLVCENRECRGYEQVLLRTLYQWRHFPVDFVVEPTMPVPLAIANTGFGIRVEQDLAVTDPSSAVLGHRYHNQFETDADLDRIQTPVVTHDAAETERRLEVAHALFDGLLEVYPEGRTPYLSVWDVVSTWMGVETALYAMADRPAYMQELVRRMVAGYQRMLDQYEAQGLLCRRQSWIHCTGAFTDELPAPGYDPAKPRLKDLWAFGLAQMLSTVSPEMFDAFEIEPCLPLLRRFGLVYYGCCDPLDRKMAQVRKIPNVRKVSMSPWVDEERGAAAIGRDLVYSRKPNPALLATPRFHEDAVREHLEASVAVCARHGCPLELILKDISTVRYEPARLWRWAEIAMQCVGA